MHLISLKRKEMQSENTNRFRREELYTMGVPAILDEEEE